MSALSTALDHLIALYGDVAGRAAFERLHARLSAYPRPLPPLLTHDVRRGRGGGEAREGGEGDAILITYGDQFRAPGEAPLRTLADFARRHLGGLISTIHILPFYPYSSDDGFSVVDYRAVDPALGSWNDVRRIGQDFRLMFDAVINHVSAGSAWFQAFLRGDPAYRDYFIVVAGGPDLSQVVRPRALPLLSRFATPTGEQAVWTTFSDDQMDLNYANPDVLLEISDLLLDYAARGAEFIRLDAIAYLWKEIGSPCIHLPQTHRVIQLWRAMFDAVAPHVMLITETNVPHVENISYFGDGANEAQLVYNFALPPLALDAFHTGSARVLSAWAGSLSLPSDRVTFFNFLASHDGIGLNPARGILPEAAIEALVARAVAHGGQVSYKHNADGTQSPYELNVNYFDALSDPAGGDAGAGGRAGHLLSQPARLARLAGGRAPHGAQPHHQPPEVGAGRPGARVGPARLAAAAGVPGLCPAVAGASRLARFRPAWGAAGGGGGRGRLRRAARRAGWGAGPVPAQRLGAAPAGGGRPGKPVPPGAGRLAGRPDHRPALPRPAQDRFAAEALPGAMAESSIVITLTLCAPPLGAGQPGDRHGQPRA
jgi:sucrose phosphorylase